MDFPTLYSRGKTGSIQQWRVWTEKNLICTEWGQVDGKKQKAVVKAEGKNIGRSNETSPRQQALNEAAALWLHRRERKYRESIEELDSEVPFLPMLALRYEDYSHTLSWPALVQRKYDGVRCMAVRKGGEIALWSRQGKPFTTLPHICKQLRKVMKDGDVFDGELYVHGEPLNVIVSWVKKQREETTQVKYHVYDMVIPQKRQELRSSILAKRMRKAESDLTHILRVPTYRVTGEAEAKQYMRRFQKQGYEGAIVRNLDGKYTMNHRSSALLKLKSWMDEEFKIIGIKDGRGKEEGLAIFVCQTKDKKTFDVRPKGTAAQRRFIYKKQKAYIGRELTVRFQKLTVYGIPFHPVGLGLRERM